MTEKKRESLFPLIQERALACSVAWVDAAEIDATDILSARMRAMQLAIDGLSLRPCLLYTSTITKDTIIGDILTIAPQTAPL